MIDVETFRSMALSYAEATEEPHFQRIAFKVNQRIFATLDLEKRVAVLKLNLDQQAEYCLNNDFTFQAVRGGWGRKGYTEVELQKVSRQVLEEALTISYRNVVVR